MNDFINRINGSGNLGRVNLPITTGRQVHDSNLPVTDSGKSFRQMLDTSLQKAQKLSFSKHAQARVEQRGVELSADDIERLEQAAGKAEKKGVTDSLMYLNNTAYIVNIPSRVVITVVDNSDVGQNVFTNIDGAVIL